MQIYEWYANATNCESIILCHQRCRLYLHPTIRFRVATYYRSWKTSIRSPEATQVVTGITPLKLRIKSGKHGKESSYSDFSVFFCASVVNLPTVLTLVSFVPWFRTESHGKQEPPPLLVALSSRITPWSSNTLLGTTPLKYQRPHQIWTNLSHDGLTYIH